MKRTRALGALFAAAPRAARLIVLPAVVLLSACQGFLGPEQDTGPQAVLKSLWNDFNEIHAYIDVRMSDNRKFNSWEDVYEFYNDELIKIFPKERPAGDRDGQILFNICCDMLRELADPHVSLYAPGGNFYWLNADEAQRKEEGWFSLSVVKGNYLEDGGNNRAGFFTYGKFKSDNNNIDNNIGYIHISSFVDNDKLAHAGWALEIDGIVGSFPDDDIKAIIIDIRGNSGGSGTIAEYIAARFASVQKNYMRASAKKGPGRNDFFEPMTFKVKPEGTRFTKRIALLTNKATVSAAEWFTIALKTQSHVTHVGTPTRGAFSPKTSRPMINGWYYTISAYRVTDMNGMCFEGTGISPDPEFVFTGDAEEGTVTDKNRDIQLEKVLEEVRKWLNP